MLQPKRTKYRKQFKGRNRGFALRGSSVSFGEFGLQTLSAAWISAKQIEAGRVAASHFLRREGRLFIRIFPHKPISAKPLEVRMGSGKGEPDVTVACGTNRNAKAKSSMSIQPPAAPGGAVNVYRPAAGFADPVTALGPPGQGRVHLGEPAPRRLQQRDHLLPLERDRRALRVVLVVGVRRLRRRDHLVERPGQRRDLRLGRGPLGLERISVHGAAAAASRCPAAR